MGISSPTINEARNTNWLMIINLTPAFSVQNLHFPPRSSLFYHQMQPSTTELAVRGLASFPKFDHHIGSLRDIDTLGLASGNFERRARYLTYESRRCVRNLGNCPSMIGSKVVFDHVLLVRFLADKLDWGSFLAILMLSRHGSKTFCNGISVTLCHGNFTSSHGTWRTK